MGVFSHFKTGKITVIGKNCPIGMESGWSLVVKSCETRYILSILLLKRLACREFETVSMAATEIICYEGI